MSAAVSLKPKIIVIGAGLGGLAGAAYFATRGHDVRIFERNARIGGKMGSLSREGFRWDMGPSLVTMADTLRNFWRSLGRELSRDLTLMPVANTCRYRWSDGAVIDENETLWNRPDVTRFLSEVKDVYADWSELFLGASPDEWPGRIRPSTLLNLRHLLPFATGKSLGDATRKHFSDQRLLDIFNSFASWTGSSPLRTPAVFALIPFVIARFGGWHVKGGNYQLVETLAKIATDAGAQIETGRDVTGFANVENGAEVSLDGIWEQCDGVLCNADLLSTYQALLPRELARWFRDTYFAKRQISTSKFLLFLGVKKKFDGLVHRNVFFSDDCRLEVAEIFSRRKPPVEPTIHVTVSSRADPGDAPDDCDNWAISVNVPATRVSVPWDEIATGYGDRIIARLERHFGFTGLRDNIVVREHFTPKDFSRRFHSYSGAMCGFASHGVLRSLLKPPMAVRTLPRFRFVGSSTHPGNGIPLVIHGAEIACRQLLSEIEGSRERPEKKP